MWFLSHKTFCFAHRWESIYTVYLGLPTGDKYTSLCLLNVGNDQETPWGWFYIDGIHAKSQREVGDNALCYFIIMNSCCFHLFWSFTGYSLHTNGTFETLNIPNKTECLICILVSTGCRNSCFWHYKSYCLQTGIEILNTHV